MNYVCMMAPGPSRCRAAHRHRFYVNVEIDRGSKGPRGRVHDIGRTGMFIELADYHCFSAHLAFNAPLSIEYVVCRVVPDWGIGVTIAISYRKSKRRFYVFLWPLQHEANTARAGAGISQAQAPLGDVEPPST
jgi:hypothetical protein